MLHKKHLPRRYIFLSFHLLGGHGDGCCGSCSASLGSRICGGGGRNLTGVDVTATLLLLPRHLLEGDLDRLLVAVDGVEDLAKGRQYLAAWP